LNGPALGEAALAHRTETGSSVRLRFWLGELRNVPGGPVRVLDTHLERGVVGPDTTLHSDRRLSATQPSCPLPLHGIELVLECHSQEERRNDGPDHTHPIHDRSEHACP